MRDWLAHRASATPTATALVEVDTGRTLTYAALDKRVEELAGRLSALGVGVDDHLGVCLSTRPVYVDLVHAAMRLGAVLVPLNARLTPPELANRLDRADVTHLVTGAATERAALDAGASCDGTIPVASVDAGDEVTGVADLDPATFDLPAWDHDCSTLLVGTSGTTGEPKFVDLTAGNLHASAAAASWRLGVLPTDRWHCTLPMYHMGGLAPVYRSTLYGTAVTVEATEGFDAAHTLEALHEYGATCLSMVPTTMRRLLDAAAERGESLPDSLRFILLGGAAAPDELLERCLDREVPIAPTYGMTETASQIATAHPREVPEAVGSVGRSLLFTDVHVLDDGGIECDPGEAGELVVNGPTVTSGYHGDPAATEQAFSTEGFHTGDAGYRDEAGRIWVLNRLDDRINTGGETVDPGEVAGALRSHPGVADAFVGGIEDGEFGERVAALVERADPALSRAELESHVRERLAGFKVPRTVAFVTDLPRTASGTVDREAARERLQAGSD